MGISPPIHVSDSPCGGKADLPTLPSYALRPSKPTDGWSFTPASPLTVKRFQTGTGIFARFPSPTPFGLGLGSD